MNNNFTEIDYYRKAESVFYKIYKEDQNKLNYFVNKAVIDLKLCNKINEKTKGDIKLATKYANLFKSIITTIPNLKKSVPEEEINKKNLIKGKAKKNDLDPEFFYSLWQTYVALQKHYPLKKKGLYVLC